MKKVIAFLCAVMLLTASAGAVEVTAPSAILMEKETGTILYAKDEHTRMEPASVTKIMTLWENIIRIIPGRSRSIL